jgi:hypothetical protein
VKIVGRGQAASNALTMMELVEEKIDCKCEINYTKALNKKGYVVDEVHILVNYKG